MKTEKTITFKVSTNFDISEEDFNKELVLAETRMNDSPSKLRFHLEQPKPVKFVNKLTIPIKQ